MLVTTEQLRRMFPHAGARLDPHLPFIGPAIERGGIDTPERIAAFLAQLAHESGEYRWMEEIWGPTAAQLGYEGRADLGNTHPGDGYRFRGRAGIGLTGRANYREASYALGVNLEVDPDKAATPPYATTISTWFWNSRKLSPLADRNWFLSITRIINGGFNGLADRVSYWNRNREILGLPPVDLDGESDAVKAFQEARGLFKDGIVGPITHAAAVLAAPPRPAAVSAPAAGSCAAAPGWDPAAVS